MLQELSVNLPNQGVTLHTRMAVGKEPFFLFAHGLSSNCLTWESVAQEIVDAGHGVVTVDLRGHGLSQKPDNGYSCQNVATDLAELIQMLDLNSPIVAGQSWGGNVVLCLGTFYPQLVSGLGLVDGGFIDLKLSIGEDWAEVERKLKPPPLKGLHVDKVRSSMHDRHPDWTEEGIEHTLGNFSIDEEGLIAPCLSLENHLKVLRGLWEMRPQEFFKKVQAPTLICVAEQPGDQDRAASRRELVGKAEADLPRSATAWFSQTDHDIHVHRPTKLAERLLSEMNVGIWADA